MSAFQDAFRSAAPNLDATFGERFEIRRMAVGEFMRQTAIASNPPAVVIGILDIPTTAVRPMGSADATKPDVIAEKPTVEFRDAVFTQTLRPPEKGDEIIALDRSGTPKFRVLDSKPDGVSHIVCQLAPL